MNAREQEIVRSYESILTDGGTPDPLVVADKPGLHTYYAPIVIRTPLRLSCHGQPGTDIPGNVLEGIREIYPEDRATGFRMDQVRGLWSVDFERSDFDDLR